MMCARIPPGQPPARLGWSWISLTSSLALRVLDEAANDFLQVYNAAVRAIRARLSFLPLPAFTFRVWLTGLTAAVLILACLTPLAFHGKAGLRYIACPNAVLRLGSGLASHASTAGGSPMPGV
jgi:hypothetical protein